MNRIVAATAAAVPLVLLAGCGGGRAGAGSGSGQSGVGVTPSSSAPTPSTAPSSPSATPSSPPMTPTPVGPAGGPVPAGFQPQSATFVSTGTGWVLGWAPCSRSTCAAVLRTTDGGAHWVGIPAPTDPVVGSSHRTDRIRFADPRDGWVFGAGLWETGDGGAHWSARGLPGISGTPRVADLEAANGVAYALAGPAAGNGLRLYRSTVGSGTWTAVTAVSSARGSAGTIALQARSAWVLVPGDPGGGLYATSTDGSTWRVRSNPCTTTGLAASALAAADARHVVLVCSGNPAAGSAEKVVLASSDGGATFVKVGAAPLGGDLVGVAMATPADYVVSAASGASWLYRSTDGGARWATALRADDGGRGYLDFGFTSATQGFAVNGQPAPPSTNLPASRMQLTHDGGATWSTVRF